MSWIINIFTFLLMNILRIRFFLRRFRIGYNNNDLVLDIGSGDNPHPRADILLEFKSNDIDRPFKLVKDERPFIIADAEALPFKDKIIDFIICSHVLEHVDNPSKAIDEIARIGKRGYIETPSEYMQKLCDIPRHKWFVKDANRRLVFTRKTRPFYDKDLNLLFFKQWESNDPYYKIWLYTFKEQIISYKWQNHISYTVLDASDSEIDTEAFKESISNEARRIRIVDASARVRIKKIIKFYYSFTTRRKQKLKNLSKQNKSLICFL